MLLRCRIYESHRSHDSLYISVRPPPPPRGVPGSKPFISVVCDSAKGLSFFLFHTLFVCVCVCSTACETNIILHSVRSRDSSAGALLSSGRAFRIAAAPSGETDELWIIVVNKRRGGGGEREERWRKAHWVSAAEGPYLFIHPSIYLTL